MVDNRNMHLILLLICFTLHQNDAADDELEVNLQFYKNVTDNFTLLKEIHEAVMNFRPIKIKRDMDNVKPDDYILNDKITKEALDMKIFRPLKYQAMLQKYEAHATKKGAERLRDIPYYLSIELHIRKDTLPPMKIFVTDFTKKARKFFNKLYKQVLLTDIDKEFSVLDTAQKFNSFVYDEQLTLLNNMIFKHNVSIPSETLMIILKHFRNEFINNKRSESEYLCVKFQICRPSLRFTDYIGDLTQELLKLPDAKLLDILLKVIMHIKDQMEFFEMLLGKTSTTDIGTKLEELVFSDLSGLRTTFVGFRSYLARKHEFTHHPDKEINTRNKALRILVDIIDQAFDLDGDELLGMHFNIISKAIADWSEGRENEIEKILKAFVMQAVGVMKINLNVDAINEIQALVDILMKREDRNKDIYRYLLTHGSTFVRGDDIPMKVSLLM